MVNERREDERVPLSLEARWDGAAGRHQARISDISMGGCFMDTTGQALVNEVVSLEIRLPSGEWLPLRGTVTFTQPHIGFSVCFTYLTDEEQRSLSQLITEAT